ncbi:DUF871 domain-containing protein [Photobacterium alginatilyticum]|uniref:DUF871 domain-containing protein n=1 Tax=Photobacterium alginatilyticum TaxID=1775171 RepID=UPI004067AED1
MRKLGISVYPELASLERNKEYIETAAKYGFSRIFTCLLSVDGDKEQIIAEFKDMVLCAKEHGFEVIADVAPHIFDDLGISYENLSFFNEMGVDGIRLDEGFTGNEEALMTFNPYGLQIELNVSVANGYLDNILSFHPDTDYLIGCHNFYPKRRSGLTREHFIKGSKIYKKHGLRVAAFVGSAVEGAKGPWPLADGLCTIEEHRDLPIDVQAKDLFYTGVVDDVIIANCFPSEEELKKLGELHKGLVTLDVELEVELNDDEEAIAFDELHFFRGDRGEYTIRSTMPRIKFKDAAIPVKNARKIRRGDVILDNANTPRYKGELHVALVDYDNDGSSNVIGRVTDTNLRFLDQVKPWQKFKLARV